MTTSMHSTYNLTKMAAQLPRDQLALMATLVDELSFWERRALMPFFSSDIHFLKIWLLAGVDEHGMLPSAQHRRRAARARAFALAARGKSFGYNEYPHWSSFPLAFAFAAMRHLFAWLHFGLPLGERRDIPFRFGDGLEMLAYVGTMLIFLGFGGELLFFAFNPVSAETANTGQLSLIFGTGTLARALALTIPPLAILRGIVFTMIGPLPKRAFAAQGATPLLWRSLLRARAWFETRADDARFKRARARSVQHEAISAAIKRASLGQGSTPEEIELERMAEAEALLQEAALRAARDPDLALSNMERSALEQSTPNRGTLRRASL